MGVDHHRVSKMPEVLEWVTGSGVVVKDWGCEVLRELTLQNCFRERGIRDFDSGLFRFAMELQLRFLDSPLD